MEPALTVKYGSIYAQDDYMIDNMAIIFNRDFGLYKYGELEEINRTYDNMINSLKEKGLTDMVEDYSLIVFDRYLSELDINEVCTLSNYMIMCSANAESLIKLFASPIEDIKTKIADLKKYGY